MPEFTAQDRIRHLEDALATQHGWNDKQARRLVELRQHAKRDAACVARLQAAVRENHQWHQTYDDLDGYPGSALEQTNLAALSLPDYGPPPLKGIPAMTKDELKQETLINLRMGLAFLEGSNEASAALVIGLHMEALRVMKQHGYISAEEAVMEVRTVYAAVEDAHPGRWEELGGPPLPGALKA